MKKLPLALGALAISTVSTGVGVSNPASAIETNEAGLSSQFVITRVNPRNNQLTVINQKFDTNAARAILQIYGLGADRINEAAYDSVINTGVAISQDGLLIFDGYTHELGLMSGVEQTLGRDMLQGDLAENLSGVLYYRARVAGVGIPVGKIDYSSCINSAGYVAAVAVAGESDVVECRLEIGGVGEANSYQPYLNGERLVEPEVASEPEPDPVIEPTSEPEASVDGSGVVVEKTETETENTAATGVEQGGAGGGVVENVARDVASGVHYAYATVTSEGSASGNSENTGVTNENATDAEVWAVDESKVWEDDAGAEVVETPELGEEDCGHFWPLVIGWGLAILGWGSAAIMVLRKRK